MKYICIKNNYTDIEKKQRKLNKEIGDIVDINPINRGPYLIDILKECYVELSEYRDSRINEILDL